MALRIYELDAAGPIPPAILSGTSTACPRRESVEVLSALSVPKMLVGDETTLIRTYRRFYAAIKSIPQQSSNLKLVAIFLALP
jgi:hypothetical protein